MTIKQLAEDLFIIPGLVNVYLLDTNDGLVLLDTGFPGRAKNVLAGLRAIGRAPTDVRHMILTHCHPDHIGNAAELKRQTGAVVWAHPIDAPFIETGTTGRRPMVPSPGLRNRVVIALLGGRNGKVKQVESVRVDRLLDDGDSPDFAPDLTTIHVPGHSAGQVAFLWRRHGGVLFPADACINRGGLKLAIATEDQPLAIASVAKLAKLDFDKLCVMHGAPIMSGAADQLRQTSFAVKM